MPKTSSRRPFFAERVALRAAPQAEILHARHYEQQTDDSAVLEEIALLRQEIASLRQEVSTKSGGQDGNTSVSPDGDDVRAVQMEIAQLVKSIGKAKSEIAAIKHPKADDDRLLAASNELDAIVKATEIATNDILEAAETIEKEAANLAALCHEDQDVVHATERMVAQVVNILEASNFQDITGQRITKVVETVRFIEQRVLSMIDIWGVEAFEHLPLPQASENAEGDEDLLNGPQLENQGISQADIDALFD